MDRESAAPRISFKTLGCKLNQAESASLATIFQRRGWQLVRFGEAAEVVVVNSCTVTASADRKSRSAVNQARKLINSLSPSPPAHLPLVVLAGCYAESRLRDTLESDGHTLVVGNDAKSLIPHLVEAHIRGEIFDLEAKKPTPFDYPVAERVFRTRGMVKIQDGCDNHCSFCIIPKVRGRGISRPLKEVLNAVKEAVSHGYKEIVLTGVNMIRWEEESLDFVDLVRSCLEVEGDWRLRLGSLEPEILVKNLNELLNHPRMSPHLHLCVQSGSDKILLKMRRQYSLRQFEEIVEGLRSQNTLFNITTDLIVGFPGETEEDFQASVALVKRMGFGHIHTFPYSRREATRASRMEEQISEDVKKKRGEIIREISEQSKRAYRSSLLGTQQKILVEEVWPQTDGSYLARGLGEYYVPSCFFLPGTQKVEDVKNQFITIRAMDLKEGQDPDLKGLVVPSE